MGRALIILMLIVVTGGYFVPPVLGRPPIDWQGLAVAQIYSLGLNPQHVAYSISVFCIAMLVLFLKRHLLDSD